MTWGGATANQLEWVRATVERYEKPLIRHAARIVGDADRARDVVQDTFLRLCEANQAKVDSRLAGWLFTVCRNRALDVRRKDTRTSAPVNEPQHNTSSSPATKAEQNETQRLVLRTLSTLPADQQEALRLKFQDQLTYREISQVMGKSLGTISNLLTLALAAMRSQLETPLAAPKEA